MRGEPVGKGFIGGQYRPLSEADVQRIHEASLTVLERTGVKVELAEALELFRSAGAEVDGNIVRIPRALVEDAVDRAPSRVVLCGREEKHDLVLEDRRVYLGTGGAALTVVDLDTQEARPARLQDVADIARLVDALENIHFYLRPVVAQDVPQALLDVNKYYAALTNTTKHVMASAYSVSSAREVIEMASLIAGSEEALRERPIISFITSWMISPLHFATETTQVLAEVVRRRIPVVLGSAPMAGSTSPVTLAGTLVQINAEELAGVVFAQLLSPGAPLLYGAVPSMADMRTGSYVGGGVEFGMLNAAAAQLAQFYELPLYNSAGLTDSKEPDIQAGYEKAFSVLQAALVGANFIHHAAGMLESMRAVAYEQYVIDNEILGMAMRAVRGIEVNDETLAVEVIDRVGPGGHFLAEKHTIRHMRSEYFYPSIADRRSREEWQITGALDARERARQRAKEILSTHRPQPIPPEIDVRIRERFRILSGSQ
ncbi:MAG: trimethylamine methyltransferase family protein [Anaerolineae bacterium]|nr:trimethylamine methyltransferase family protein [Anaerolineae bacterium]